MNKTSCTDSRPRHSPMDKVRLGGRIVHRYLLVTLMLRRTELPTLVPALGRTGDLSRPRLPPGRLARAVDRTLRFGAERPTCLVNALVLFRLLREQGDPAELVIGLPPSTRSHEAHAWVEIDGVDVGPPPGRGRHEAIARFR